MTDRTYEFWKEKAQKNTIYSVYSKLLPDKNLLFFSFFNIAHHFIGVALLHHSSQFVFRI